jgi:mono/diheme cytochrome c family protein
MTDERSGRELTPRQPDEASSPDSAITPIAEPDSRAVERFSAGPRAHSVGLTEARAAQIVRQSGNARNVVFLALLVIAIFIPVYWFYEAGIPAVGAEGRLEREGQVQYVTDVARGYDLYLANCARCHGEEGGGGIGPPLNDQAKLYNALTADGEPGTGHLDPIYLDRVLTVGGRYVCGDPESLMPAFREPEGPLNYRQIEELIAWVTASRDIVFEYDPAAHGAVADAAHAEPSMVRGWRDPSWEPAPGATPPPACWRAPGGVTGGDGAGAPGTGEAIEPGTPEAPRVIALEATGTLQFVDESGAPLTAIAVVAGETVTFEVDNTAGFDHNFYIGTEEELMVPGAVTDVGIPTWTEGVETLTWTVEADEALQFACTVPGHYQPMHGDFVLQDGDGA